MAGFVVFPRTQILLFIKKIDTLFNLYPPYFPYGEKIIFPFFPRLKN